jgi:hypothetical protein
MCNKAILRPQREHRAQQVTLVSPAASVGCDFYVD